MDISPAISVIVPNYNHAKYLPERLESIVNQTFKNYELIVLDDCSTDNSVEVIEAHRGKMVFRTEYNVQNSGSPFIQWVRGAKLAKADYLWIAESDDSAYPSLLEELYAVTRNHPNVGICYSQSMMMDEAGREIGIYNFIKPELGPDRWRADYTNRGVEEVSRFLIRQNTVPNASAVLVRRDVFLDGSEGSESMRLMGDWWTWARVMMKSDVHFLSAPLNRFRIHTSSVRASTRKATSCLEELMVKGHICSNVTVPERIRRAAARDSLNVIWKVIEEVKHGPDRDWLNRVTDNLVKVHPKGGTWIRWLLIKRIIARMGWLKSSWRILKFQLRSAPHD